MAAADNRGSRSAPVAADRNTPVQRRVRFGAVTVSVQEPTKTEVDHNVCLSTEALDRAGCQLARKGVRLSRTKNVPLFYLDTKKPGRFVRRLNGKVEYGVLENGRFKVTD